MKITIITINYNNKLGLKKTIDSIQFQTDSNFEYIIIDGNSTDGSKELLKEVRFENKIIISEPDKGIFNAMNKGARLAHNEYILFLNSGDSLADENVIHDIYKAGILNEQIDIIAGNTICESNNKFSHLWISPDYITINTFYSGSICHQSTLIKRQLLIKFPYIESNRFCSDRLHFMKVLCFEGATYKTYHRNISRFDCSGISSSQNNEQIKEKEVRQNIEDILPKIFLLDYDFYIGKRSELEKLICNHRHNALVKAISHIILLAKKIKIKFKKLL